MPGARNSRRDEQRLKEIRQSAVAIINTTFELGIEQEEDSEETRSILLMDLDRIVWQALRSELGAEDTDWVPDWTIVETLPVERATIIRETETLQLWRVPWKANDDESVTIAPREQWTRVTQEYIPVVDAQHTVAQPASKHIRLPAVEPVRVIKETDHSLTVQGYGVVFGAQDLYGETFTRETNFMRELVPNPLVLYGHGISGPPDWPIGKVVKTEPDEYGLWVTAQLDKSDAYTRYIQELIEKGVLGWSSGSAAHMVRYADDQQTIKQWPVIEMSLTPTPAEPRTVGVRVTRQIEEPQRAATDSGETAVDPKENNNPQADQQPSDQSQTAQPAQQQAPANSPTAAPTPTAPAPQQQQAPAPQPVLDMSSMRSMLEEFMTSQIAPLREQLDAMRNEPPPRNAGGTLVPETPMSDADRALRSFDIAVRQGRYALRADDNMNTMIGTEGGILVPEVHSNTILQELTDTRSIMRVAGATVMSSPGGNPYKVPQSFASGRANLTREEHEFDTDAPRLGEIQFMPYKYTRLTKVTDEMLQDGRFDVVGRIIIPDVTAAFAKAENEDFLLASGAAEPQGLLTSAAVGATSTKASIEYDDLINLEHSMRQEYRDGTVWLTNDNTIAALRKLKDGNGIPVWQGALTAGAPSTLLGRPIYTLEHMPTIEASAKVLVLANMRFFWIIDFAGMEMKRLDELYAANGMIGFRWYRRFDSRVVDTNAFRVLQMKA